LHPDGRRVVVSVTRPDFGADAYVGQLWELPAGAGADVPALRRLTRGFRDTAPQYSPDGATLAFLRTGPGGKPQLHLIDARGGEPQALTDQQLGVEWFSWSPDSAQVIFTSRVPEHGRYGTVDGIPAGREDARLVLHYKYRMNGVGYTRDKRTQIFVLDVPAADAEPYIAPTGRTKEDTPDGGNGLPAPIQLTDADADHNTPVFSHDGQRILFSAALDEQADENLITDIYSIAVDGSDRSRLSNLAPGSHTACSRPVQSSDGQWLFYLGSELSGNGRDFVARNTGLYAAPADAPASARRLTDAETIDLGEIPDIVPSGTHSVLVFNRTRGRVELLEVSAGGEVGTVQSGELAVTGAAVAGDDVVISFAAPGTMGDVARAAEGALVPLSDFSAVLRQRTSLIQPCEEVFRSVDGYEVHGWVFLPEGEGPHPVLLNIHGGPFAQYGWGYFDEPQVYTDAGYAVVMCNPRGSAGYGQRHGRAVKEAMGKMDLVDVLGFLEGALGKYPALDRERLGVMGGSYGGYLTAWSISQDHRFTAAVVERGYLDPPSFIGSSDIGWFFSAEYTGTDPDHVRRQNPFAHVDAVRTPTLVIHSEEDLRCPVEQAQRYYTALKMRGVPTELLLFPGENHELSRSGSPWHRRQRFEHTLRWWAQWLPTEHNQPDRNQPVGSRPEGS
jgi:dipeptidyl aminopeptidase/acylaminoacyl peptidase